MTYAHSSYPQTLALNSLCSPGWPGARDPSASETPVLWATWIYQASQLLNFLLENFVSMIFVILTMSTQVIALLVREFLAAVTAKHPSYFFGLYEESINIYWMNKWLRWDFIFKHLWTKLHKLLREKGKLLQLQELTSSPLPIDILKPKAKCGSLWRLWGKVTDNWESAAVTEQFDEVSECCRNKKQIQGFFPPWMTWKHG